MRRGDTKTCRQTISLIKVISHHTCTLIPSPPTRYIKRDASFQHHPPVTLSKQCFSFHLSPHSVFIYLIISFSAFSPLRFLVFTSLSVPKMMEMMRKYQLPEFGSWNYYDEIPITQYFNSRGAGLYKAHFFAEDGQDLFQVLSPYSYNGQEKVKKGVVGKQVENLYYKEGSIKKPKAVDEDLYKIPPELICKMPKKQKKMLWNLLPGCLSINCIA